MTQWWLSFADPELPKGTQFLGVAIVEAESFHQALQLSHAIGVNPGGEVCGYELNIGRVSAEYTNRLLQSPEVENITPERVRQ